MTDKKIEEHLARAVEMNTPDILDQLLADIERAEAPLAARGADPDKVWAEVRADTSVETRAAGGRRGQSWKKSVMGLAAAAPTYVCYVLLLLSSNGTIGNFYPAYKLINSMFAPAVNIFAVTADAKALSAAQLVGIGLLPLVFPLITWTGFRLGYDDTDLAKKFVYKSQK